MHASPTASLGQNANGGLNVYVREVCTAFSDRGIATDIFTRKQSIDAPNLEQLAPLSRVVYLPAGKDLDKYSLFREVPSFAERVMDFAAAENISYDLLYSHYWLSGEVACLLRPASPGRCLAPPVAGWRLVGRPPRTPAAWSRPAPGPPGRGRSRNSA